MNNDEELDDEVPKKAKRVRSAAQREASSLALARAREVKAQNAAARKSTKASKVKIIDAGGEESEEEIYDMVPRKKAPKKDSGNDDLMNERIAKLEFENKKLLKKLNSKPVEQNIIIKQEPMAPQIIQMPAPAPKPYDRKAEMLRKLRGGF